MWHIYSPRQSKNILSLIDTGRKVCGAGSTKLLGVRPSVPSFGCCTALQRSSLLPWARRAGDIHRLLHGPANSSKCEQRHVVSWQRLVLHSEQPGAVPNYPTYMRTIIRPHGTDAAYCYRHLTYRGPCVAHTSQLCKNDWTDRDAIYRADSCWLKESMVQIPRGTLGGGGQVTALWPIKSIERCGVYWVRRCVPLRR